uniref:Ig-like domain-containing protein n=1 Tax=Pygocentrus nattereri TaxID=42514 RepID=A0A3B4C1C6_PYGNA
ELLQMTKSPLVVSAAPGETVTLNCPPVGDSDVDVNMWYKQRLEHAPLEVGSKFKTRDSIISAQFDRSRFKIERTAQSVSLSIERVTKGDEGMYFCAAAGEKTMNFSTATFLAVTGKICIVLMFSELLIHTEIYFKTQYSSCSNTTLSCYFPELLNISVLQTPVLGSVSPGESVTLQCTVLSEIRAADLQVLWFRAAAGQSFPEIIYTHQNSSSRQCEISSSTSCSLYEFSKNILDQHHTGTYYCAVAACGKIIIGNGTSVELSKCFFALFALI